MLNTQIGTMYIQRKHSIGATVVYALTLYALIYLAVFVFLSSTCPRISFLVPCGYVEP